MLSSIRMRANVAENPITMYKMNMTLVLLAHAGPLSGPGAGEFNSSVWADGTGGHAPGELDIIEGAIITPHQSAHSRVCPSQSAVYPGVSQLVGRSTVTLKRWIRLCALCWRCC